MEYVTIKRDLIPQFSELSNKLADQQGLDFAIQLPFSRTNIEKQLSIKELAYSELNRSILVKNLHHQYSQLGILADRFETLSLLANENTYVTTTGHQLNIGTGPLYFLIKIIQTIKLADELQLMYPTKTILPIFWMATEDHDLEEIKSVSIFNTSHTWKSEQTGAVGRMNTENLDELKTAVLNQFTTAKQRDELVLLFEQYKGETLAEATFKLVHQLFKTSKLLIINADQKELKKLFIPTMLAEINNKFAQFAVQQQNNVLEKNGIKTQAFVRDINLFYLSKTGREKLLVSDKGVQIENVGDFTLDEINTLLTNEPQNFSPNVILRPVYQETILPNLVYTGGAGELAYWLQLKGVFETANIPFPLLLLRNSIVFTSTTSEKKINKLGISLVDLFQNWGVLSKKWMATQNEDDLEDVIESSFLHFSKEITLLLLKNNPNRKTLAEMQAGLLDKQKIALLQRLTKEKKQKFEIELKQLEDLQEKINPNGDLMERSQNFLNFLGNLSIQEFIQLLYAHISNENQDLKVIEN
jgi:bacillithiol biosynthesis cysteine-adding enzyme BshC